MSYWCYRNVELTFLFFFMQAVCSPLNSDVFHLAVNLMDRYLSHVQLESEADYTATAVACTMISHKIRRARRECLNYDNLKHHFRGTSEKNIRVSSFLDYSLLCFSLESA